MMDSRQSSDPRQSPNGKPRPRLPMRARIAMTSFLLGIMMCIPLSGVVAVLMGMWSLPRLRDEVQFAGFARAARWGILLGTVNCIVQCMGFGQFQAWYHQQVRVAMEQRTTTAMMAVQDGEFDKFYHVWLNTPEAKPDEADVRAFADALKERYGRLQRVSITHSEFIQDGPSLLAPPQAIGAILLTFEDTEIFGEARYRLTVSSSLSVPVPYLRSIRLEDRGGSPLMLGEKMDDATSSGASATGSGSTSANGDEGSDS